MRKISRKVVAMKIRRKIRHQLTWYSFIIISVICLVVLTYIPMATTIKYSFYDARTLGFEGSFNGLQNYKILVSNPAFLQSVLNTFVLTALSLLQIPIGYIFACLINSIRKQKIQSFFRVGYYMPNIITGVSVVLVFQVVLKQNDGLLNRALSAILHTNVEIGWLSEPSMAKFGATILSLWSNIGYCILICLANLQGISHEIREAAEVDGANGIKNWWYITTPLMKDCFIFLFITNTITGFARFTDLFIIGGNSASGRPGGALQTLLMYIYQYSFEYPNFGMASAGAMILFVLTFAVTMLNLKFTGFFKKSTQ